MRDLFLRRNEKKLARAKAIRKGLGKLGHGHFYFVKRLARPASDLSDPWAQQHRSIILQFQ